MSTPQRLPTSFKARNVLEQYLRPKRRSRQKTKGNLPSLLLSESKTLVNGPHIEKHTIVTQGTASTFSLRTLEPRPTVRKHYSLSIRKHFFGTEIKDPVHSRLPSFGIHRICDIETDLGCKGPNFETESKDGASQLHAVDTAEKSKEDIDSVSGEVSQPSRYRKSPGPSIPSITTLGISSQTHKSEDRPSELAYGLRRRREHPESPFNMRRIIARASEENQRRHYTTSSVASYNAAMATPRDAEVFIPSRNLPIREHLRLWQEHQDKTNSEYAVMEGREEVFSPRKAGVTTPKLEFEDDRTLVTEDTDIPKTAEDVVEEEDQVPDLFQDRPVFELGEMVELDTIREPILAVFTGNVQDQSQFYTINGQWVHRGANQVKFRVPQMISADTLQEILPYLPKVRVSVEKLDQLHEMEHTVPREAGAAIIKQLFLFRAKSEALYRKYAAKLDSIHEVLAHPRHTKSAALSDIAHLLLDEQDLEDSYYPSLWTVHKALRQNALGFQIDMRNHRNTGMFTIRPKHDVDMINRVRQWTRDYQESLVMAATEEDWSCSGKDSGLHKRLSNPIATFIAKAKPLLSKSRTTRDITKMGSLGPSSVKYRPIKHISGGSMWTKLWHSFPQESFTEEESDILRFLILYGSGHLGVTNTSSLASIGPMIVRATGMYDGTDVTQSTSWMLCQELGIIKPWQNRTLLSAQLALPGHGFNYSTDYLKNAQLTVDASSLSEDSMKDLRKDWKEMEVFCIDSVDAAEIDDGISLEPFDEAAGIYWIHVHVANPTAFISTSSPIAKYAAHVGQTIYLPEGIYPMLEPSISQKYFSLASGRPTLTVSIKINTEGEILDYTIAPGRIHNVVYVSPLTVAQALSGLRDEIKRPDLLTVGGEIPIKQHREMHEILTPSQVDTLKKLSALGIAHRNRRSNVSQSVHVGFASRAEASITFHPPEIIYPQGPCKAFQIQGDPTIAMQPVPVGSTSPPWHTSSTLVAEVMVLACNVAALWCKERGIPLVYRGTTSTNDARARGEFIRTAILPAISQYGFIPRFLRTTYMEVVGMSAMSDQPISHDIIGTKAYTRVTSPLRRYGDMLAHWQIEAALLEEGKTGKSLANSQRSYSLPFNRQKVQSILPTLIDRERVIRKYQLFAERHWIAQFMFRAFYFKEAMLPDTFNVTIQDGPWKDSKSGTYRCESVINDLGITCDVTITEASRQQGGLNVGDIWEAKIDHVNCWTRDVVMTPIRLMEKDVG